MTNAEWYEKTGGMAFPTMDNSLGILVLREPGMTLRDYFAAKAVAGMLADPQVKIGGSSTKILAGNAYEVADAMLIARGKV